MRLRVRFAKHGKVRFTSHRDAARIWERTCRKAGLRVAYSEGFSPRPKLSFGLALSTGYESRAEYLDIDLADGGDDLDAVRQALAEAVPDGFEVHAVVVLPPGSPSLQEAVTSSTWWVDVAEADVTALAAAVSQVMAADEVSLSRERKARRSTDDVRGDIRDLAVVGPIVLPDGRPAVRLAAELASVGRALRPAELVEVLTGTTATDGAGDVRVLRLAQWIDDGGSRREPIPLG